jgi:hypothetical protein
MMKLLTVIFCLAFFTPTAFSQGLTEIAMPGIDTLKSVQTVRSVSGLSTPLFNPEFPLVLSPEMFVLDAPVFDFKPYMQSNWKVEYQNSIGFHPEARFSFGNPFMVSPLFHTGTIFNQATYSLSDKLTLGGNSFGVNSIFTAPLPHPAANQWETRGASMFMQYKVNKNFKIETRISVTGNQYHP